MFLLTRFIIVCCMYRLKISKCNFEYNFAYLSFNVVLKVLFPNLKKVTAPCDVGTFSLLIINFVRIVFKISFLHKISMSLTWELPTLDHYSLIRNKSTLQFSSIFNYVSINRFLNDYKLLGSISFRKYFSHTTSYGHYCPSITCSENLFLSYTTFLRDQWSPFEFQWMIMMQKCMFWFFFLFSTEFLTGVLYMYCTYSPINA